MYAPRFWSLWLATALSACSAEIATPPDTESHRSTPSLASLHDTRDGPSFATNPDARQGVSVFIKYDAARAPLDRVEQIMGREASFTGDVESMATLAAILPEDRIKEVTALSWVRRVERGTDSGRPGVAAPHDRAAEMAQAVPWGVGHIQADLVHQGGNRADGITVAILDTGIDCTHPDLSARIVGGYDYVSGSSSYCQTPGDHGTQVTGVVAATDNASGVVGVAPEADVRMYRVCQPFQCYETHMYYALWAASYAGASVINVSIVNCGQNAAPSMLNLMDALYQVGRTIVFAAGNGEPWGCPPGSQPSGWARSPHTLAVSAVEPISLDTASAYSYGPSVDFAAPHRVLSTTTGGTVDGPYAGTSFAAPHVAGTVALMLATGDYSGLSGSQIPAAVKSKLINSATDMGPTGKDNYWGYGIIDALSAVSTPPPPPLSAEIMGPFEVPPGQSCSWQAVVTGGSPPYTYQWSGALSGTSISVSGSVGSSGYLYLTVTDSSQDQEDDQFYVLVDPGAECLE